MAGTRGRSQHSCADLGSIGSCLVSTQRVCFLRQHPPTSGAAVAAGCHPKLSLTPVPPWLLLRPCPSAAAPAPAAQVPYRLQKNFHKIQQRLVRELEKKFSGKDVVIVANRRILPPPSNGKSSARPRSRTLTAVSGWWGSSSADALGDTAAVARD